MKYNDKNTLISNSNYLDRDLQTMTTRESRRLDKIKYKKFLSKFSTHINKDWWDCLDVKDQRSIYREYENILRISKRTNKKPNFKSWVYMIRRDYKPNVQLYRDCVIDNLLK